MEQQNEERIKKFHQWIGKLCDPDSSIIKTNSKFQAEKTDQEGQKILRCLANKSVSEKFRRANLK